MPCYHPLEAFRAKGGDVTFDKGRACSLPFFLPCGQCIGCRLERSRQWAVRMMHEASLWEQNCFLTLTYDDEHLPSNGSLCLEDIQKFMKRLRRFALKTVGSKIRLFYCGEYGEKTYRPHYHAVIFNFDFADKVLFSVSGETRLYVSADLLSLWKFGHCVIGSVTFESAAYVAAYCLKKVTGSAADSHYERVIEETGELVQVTPEFAHMSRRPGIGQGWYDKYKDEVFPADEVFARGRLMKPPRFYDKLFEVEQPEAFEALKRARKQASANDWRNNTSERLRVREIVKKARLSRNRRDLE